MTLSRLKSLSAAVSVIAMVAGGAALAYGRWTKPLLDADRALAEGQEPSALAGYAEAERRLGRFRLTQYLFAREYTSSVYNQLALLYRAGEYDALLQKASTAPAAAAPHFWSGLVLLRAALAEQTPETRLAGLSRAEQELKQALQESPDDWDTRFNYEIAARLAASLRQHPKKTDEPLRLLRPQPRMAQPARKVG